MNLTIALKYSDKFPREPRLLFLIDGLGALLSAFLLGFVLVQWESFFGIPRQALYGLALIPCFFAAYDLICYQFGGSNSARYLKGIALLNAGYCCLSAIVAAYHHTSITIWGRLYLAGEIAVVLTLAYWEWRRAAQWRRR
jgi:hypothetical protein